jgi:hypothetical protein
MPNSGLQLLVTGAGWFIGNHVADLVGASRPPWHVLFGVAPALGTAQEVPAT